MAETSSQPLFLGLDLSTQQLKAIVITQDLDIVHESAVNFARDLPQYGTENGAIKGPDEGEVTSPVAMWVEAMDLLLARMKEASVDFPAIVAVSGAGQVCGYNARQGFLLTARSNMVQCSGRRTPNLVYLLWILHERCWSSYHRRRFH